MNEQKWTKDEKAWGRAVCASEAARVLHLPATVAQDGRAVVETAAVLAGIPSPHDLSDEQLEKDLEEACDRELEELAEIWAALGGGKPQTLSRAAEDLNGTWSKVDRERWGAGKPINLEDGQAIELIPSAWAPILDPQDPLFDPRVELAPDPSLDSSIAAAGVIVPVIVTADLLASGNTCFRLVVLDGLQRLGAARRINRARLTEAAETGKAPPLIRTVPARVVIGDGVQPALGASNELRRGQDAMTRAVRLESLRRSGLSLEAAAATMGLRRRMAANYVSLLKLSGKLQRLLRRDALSFKLARILCQLDEEDLQHRALESVRSLSIQEKTAGLKAALADDAMVAALRGGAFIRSQRLELVPPGAITRCPRSKVWFLVEKGGPRDGDGRWVAPGAKAVELKPAERISARARKYTTKREHQLIDAAIAAYEGRDVPKEFAWLINDEETDQVDVEDYVAAKRSKRKTPPPQVARS